MCTHDRVMCTHDYCQANLLCRLKFFSFPICICINASAKPRGGLGGTTPPSGSLEPSKKLLREGKSLWELAYQSRLISAAKVSRRAPEPLAALK